MDHDSSPLESYLSSHSYSVPATSGLRTRPPPGSESCPDVVLAHRDGGIWKENRPNEKMPVAVVKQVVWIIIPRDLMGTMADNGM